MAEKKATKRRWVRGVETVSTYPPEGTFAKDAESIARTGLGANDVDNPMAPASSAARSNPHIAATSSSVATRSLAASLAKIAGGNAAAAAALQRLTAP